jgi:hypothetical protein
MRGLSTPQFQTMLTAAATAPVIRLLQPADIDRLLVLEHQQWTARQAACADTMLQRMAAWPLLSIGAFCPHSGAALASLFLRPVRAQDVRRAATWYDCASAPPGDAPAGEPSLFGISMTSVHPGAVQPMLQHLWLQAVRNGWREVYLGSPIPGLRRALQRRPGLAAEAYARQYRHGLPADPQLRYYHGKGFREIVAVRPGYFPHEESLDHGVVLRHALPYGDLQWMLRQMPDTLLRQIAAGLYLPAGAGLRGGGAVVRSVAEVLGL